jgi:hypothetical protein
MSDLFLVTVVLWVALASWFNQHFYAVMQHAWTYVSMAELFRV